MLRVKPCKSSSRIVAPVDTTAQPASGLRQCHAIGAFLIATGADLTAVRAIPAVPANMRPHDHDISMATDAVRPNAPGWPTVNDNRRSVARVPLGPFVGRTVIVRRRRVQRGQPCCRHQAKSTCATPSHATSSSTTSTSRRAPSTTRAPSSASRTGTANDRICSTSGHTICRDLTGRPPASPPIRCRLRGCPPSGARPEARSTESLDHHGVCRPDQPRQTPRLPSSCRPQM